MELLKKGMENINQFFNEYQDPRTGNWLLMSSPFYTLGICISYVIIVKHIGPKLMENRKPFGLKNTLIVYNFLQVIFSAWLFYRASVYGWLGGDYNWRCQPIDRDNMQMAETSWWYYISKFTEFFDTFFFVMRKKFDQVSTLHVIHHGIMPMSVWVGVKLSPGGHSTFFGFLNTFVHIVMYTYYFLSAFGPRFQKYLWWKKYLTVLQIAQFIGIMVHAFQLLFIECDYPRAFVWFIGMHAVLFFFLFREFYNEAYNNRRKLESLNSNGYKSNNHALKNGESKHQQNYQDKLSNGQEVTKRNVQASDYYMHSNIPMEIQRELKSE